jgi:hypothetical protein
LVYVCLGNGRHVNELRFSVLTAAQFLGDGGNWNILLFSDSAQPFEGLPVQFRYVEPSVAARWCGPHQYVYRSKICALAASLDLQETERSVIVDGDTYFKQSPSRLFERVGPGAALMHLREGPPEASERAALEATLNKKEPVDLNGDLWHIRAREIMWNSGVVGLHKLDSVLCNEAIHLTDQLLDQGFGELSHTAEMVAFGVTLARRTKVRECFDIIVHYWQAELRQPFSTRLSATWADESLSHDEQLTALWPHRPRADFKARSKFFVKRLARKVRVEL